MTNSTMSIAAQTQPMMITCSLVRSPESSWSGNITIHHNLARHFYLKSWLVNKNLDLSMRKTLTYVNPLPDDKIIDWSKLKQITDDILNSI